MIQKSRFLPSQHNNPFFAYFLIGIQVRPCPKINIPDGIIPASHTHAKQKNIASEKSTAGRHPIACKLMIKPCN